VDGLPPLDPRDPGRDRQAGYPVLIARFEAFPKRADLATFAPLGCFDQPFMPMDGAYFFHSHALFSSRTGPDCVRI